MWGGKGHPRCRQSAIRSRLHRSLYLQTQKLLGRSKTVAQIEKVAELQEVAILDEVDFASAKAKALGLLYAGWGVLAQANRAHRGGGLGALCRIRSAKPVMMTLMVDAKMSKSAGEH